MRNSSNLYKNFLIKVKNPPQCSLIDDDEDNRLSEFFLCLVQKDLLFDRERNQEVNVLFQSKPVPLSLRISIFKSVYPPDV